MQRQWVLFAILLCAVSASASNNRSAVSVSGLDTNPCTPASPCRSFTAAIAATNSGGEIIALDSAGYGPFTVSISVTVSGAPGVHAAITSSSSDAITVNAGSTDRVSLRNLVCIGSGAHDGINFGGGAQLEVVHCLIRGFAFGISADRSDQSNVAIDQTTLLDCSTAMQFYGDFGGVNTLTATVTNSLMQGGTQGVQANYSTKVLVSHCTITGNVTGALSYGNAGGAGLVAELTIEDSVIAHNIHGASVYQVLPDVAKLTLSRNLIAYSSSEGVFTNNAVAYTFGDNLFAGNLDDVAPFPLTPVSLK